MCSCSYDYVHLSWCSCCECVCVCVSLMYNWWCILFVFVGWLLTFFLTKLPNDKNQSKWIQPHKHVCLFHSLIFRWRLLSRQTHSHTPKNFHIFRFYFIFKSYVRGSTAAFFFCIWSFFLQMFRFFCFDFSFAGFSKVLLI